MYLPWQQTNISIHLYLVTFSVTLLELMSTDFRGKKKTVGPNLFSTCWVIFETASPTCLQWCNKYAVLSVPKGPPSERQDDRPPRWSSGKEPTCQCRRCEFHPWVRKMSWRRKWQPTPVFLLGKIPWIEEPGGLQSMAYQRVGHN